MILSFMSVFADDDGSLCTDCLVWKSDWQSVSYVPDRWVTFRAIVALELSSIYNTLLQLSSPILYKAYLAIIIDFLVS